MKKLFSLFSGCALVFLFSCQKGDKGCTDPNAPNYDPDAEVSSGNCGYPTSAKRALLILVNQTDNPDCGTFTLPMFQSAISQFQSRLIPLVIHPSNADPLFSGTSVSLAAGLDITSFPNIAVDNVTNALSQQQITDAVELSLSQPALANVKAEFFIQGDSAFITIYGMAFADISGDVYATAYLVEDDVDQVQAGAAPGFKHDYVLREGGNGAFGAEVADHLKDGDSFKQQYSVYLDPSWNTANLHLVGAVWEKEGETFKLLNVSLE